MALVSHLLGQQEHSKQAAHDKQSWALAARGLGAMARFGGKALAGGGGRLAARALGSAPGVVSNTLGRAAPALHNAGKAISGVGNRMGAWGNLRAARQAGARMGAAPMAGNYSRGLRAVNNGMDAWAGRGGMGRKFVRNTVGQLVPKTWFGGASLGTNVALIGDRANHAHQVEDAANYGAAKTLYDLRQNPISTGLPALFANSGTVADGMAKDHALAAGHLRNLSQYGEQYSKPYERRTRWGAMVPGGATAARLF